VRLATRADSTGWDKVLVGVATVVHLAARVHVMRDTEINPLTAFRAINVEGTLNLAPRVRQLNAKER
jgi:UDP-glucose 4-epimerase